MRGFLRFGLLLLVTHAASGQVPPVVVDHDLDAQVCEAAARTILAASPASSAIIFIPGGDPTRENCIADLLARDNRVLSQHDGPDVLGVWLRGDEVHADRFSTRLALSSYNASGSAWTHVGRLEFVGSVGRWRFARFLIDKYIDGRRVR